MGLIIVKHDPIAVVLFEIVLEILKVPSFPFRLFVDIFL
jgi:hypothetical protein